MGQRVNSHFVHITRLFLIYLRVSSCWCIQPRRRSVVASKRISCAFVIAQSRFFFIPEGKTSCHWDISSSGRVRSANCKKILFCILRLKDVWIGRQHTVLACTSDCLSLPRIYAYLYKKSAEEKVWFTFSVGVFRQSQTSGRASPVGVGVGRSEELSTLAGLNQTQLALNQRTVTPPSAQRGFSVWDHQQKLCWF